MAPKRGAASAPPDDQGARFQAQSPRKSLKHDIALGEFLSHSRLESSERRARSSISFSGKDIRMERLLTDREPGLTSHEGIAEFLAKRVAHEIAAADAVNQTPFLDGFIRRVQDVASSLLDAAGLSEEFWEFAINAAVRLTNMMPTSRHHRASASDPRDATPQQATRNLGTIETLGSLILISLLTDTPL